MRLAGGRSSYQGSGGGGEDCEFVLLLKRARCSCVIFGITIQDITELKFNC